MLHNLAPFFSCTWNDWNKMWSRCIRPWWLRPRSSSTWSCKRIGLGTTRSKWCRPLFIPWCLFWTRCLHRTKLYTGEQLCHRLSFGIFRCMFVVILSCQDNHRHRIYLQYSWTKWRRWRSKGQGTCRRPEFFWWLWSSWWQNFQIHHTTRVISRVWSYSWRSGKLHI